MRTEVRVLTRRENRKEHHETLIEIDWSDVTPEVMQTLAQWAIVHEAQCRMSKAEENPPERLKIKASALIHQAAPLILARYSPPPVKVKLGRDLEKGIEALTEEEKAELIALLT